MWCIQASAAGSEQSTKRSSAGVRSSGRCLIVLLPSSASSGTRNLPAAVWRPRFLAVVLPYAGWVSCSIVHVSL